MKKISMDRAREINEKATRIVFLVITSAIILSAIGIIFMNLILVFTGLGLLVLMIILAFYMVILFTFRVE